MNINQLVTIHGLYESTNDEKTKAHLLSAARRVFNLNFNVINAKEESLKLTPAEIYAGREKNKVAAIKLYRDRTGRGLKESKDAVEGHFHKNGLLFGNQGY